MGGYKGWAADCGCLLMYNRRRCSRREEGRRERVFVGDGWVRWVRREEEKCEGLRRWDAWAEHGCAESLVMIGVSRV